MRVLEMESRQEQSRRLYRGLRYTPVKTAGLVTFRAWEGCRSVGRGKALCDRLGEHTSLSPFGSKLEMSTRGRAAGSY